MLPIHYRARASTLRRLAEAVADPRERARFLDFASEYEKWPPTQSWAGAKTRRTRISESNVTTSLSRSGSAVPSRLWSEGPRSRYLATDPSWRSAPDRCVVPGAKLRAALNRLLRRPLCTASLTQPRRQAKSEMCHQRPSLDIADRKIAPAAAGLIEVD